MKRWFWVSLTNRVAFASFTPTGVYVGVVVAFDVGVLAGKVVVAGTVAWWYFAKALTPKRTFQITDVKIQEETAQQSPQ